jgi:hypothetical protein
LPESGSGRLWSITNLAYGLQRPLAINPWDLPVYPDKSKSTKAPRGIVIDFDLEDE